MSPGKNRKKQTGNKTSNQCSKEYAESPPPIIKSPMDPNDYLWIQLPNGLKALLISTIEYQKEVTNGDLNPITGVFSKVEEFNRKFVKIPDEDVNDIVNNKPNNIDENCNSEPERKKAKLIENSESKPKEELPNSDTSASVSLTIGAGSIHDPSDFLGMAHICEHACFCFGSKKYPELDLLTELVQRWEGEVNCFTGNVTTVYCFHMNIKVAGVTKFLTAIDILTNFVANPILPENKINKEVHSIDSEFSLNQFDDAYKFSRLFCSLGDVTHPFGRFGCGNYQTLAQANLYTRLCEWKERHYAANYMTVVIKAPLPIEDLEKITHEYFSIIQSSSEPLSPMQEILKCHRNPFNTNRFNKLYKFVPSSNLKMAIITWTLPAKFSNDIKTKPFVYLRHLFDEGSSLAKYLRDKKWSYDVYAHFHSDLEIQSFCSLFSLCVPLTDSGVVEIFQIIKAIFSYLKMMTSLKANEDIFNEIRRECANTFHYDDFVYNIMNTNQLSYDMQTLKNPKYILTSQKLVTDFKPEILEECVDLLTPCNMNVIVCSKSYEDECKEIEKWHETKYCTCEFDQHFLEACNKVKPYKEFKPPASNNPFRIKNFIYFKKNLNNQSTPIRESILNSNKASVEYYKQNIYFIGSPPSGYSTVSIASPLIEKSELNQILLTVWILMLQDKLNTVLRQAEKARIQSHLYTQEYLIKIALYGPSRDQTKIIQLILETFMEFENLVQQTTYNDFRLSLLESLANTTLNSYVFLDDLTKFILNQKFSLIEQYLAVANKGEFQDFKNMLCGFKDRLFISVVLFGCISTFDAEALTNYIRSMNYRELPEIFPVVQSNRAMQLPTGDRCLRVMAKNELDNNSCVINHYQLQHNEFNKESLHQFFRKFIVILQHAVHLQLRMDEHLSYDIGVLYSQYCGEIVLSFTVAPQPHRHTTGYVDERIDVFLAKFRDQFACYETMFPQSSYTFPAPISKDEHNILLQIYDNCLLPSGKDFRKLSVQVVGHRDESKIGEPLEATCIQNKIEKYASNSSSFGFLQTSNLDLEYDIPDDLYDQNGYFITDIEDFKDSLFVYPSSE